MYTLDKIKNGVATIVPVGTSFLSNSKAILVYHMGDDHQIELYTIECDSTLHITLYHRLVYIDKETATLIKNKTIKGDMLGYAQEYYTLSTLTQLMDKTFYPHVVNMIMRIHHSYDNYYYFKVVMKKTPYNVESLHNDIRHFEKALHLKVLT